MLYRRLTLVGYTRIALTGYKNIELIFTEPLQVILGTNGAGKSSLMSEISPWPAAVSDYLKTGSKEIEIEHNQNTFILKSVFSPQQRHSFKIDGQEFNPGGTLTVQKELIKEHFRLTQEILPLIQMRDRFTSMSIAKRKDLFITLCDTNYDYALKCFHRLKDRHRDIIGGIKLTKDRIVVESEKLLEDTEVARLREEAEALQEVLVTLSEQRMPVTKSPDMLELEQGRLDQKLKSFATRLDMLYVFEAEYNLSVDEVELKLRQLDNSLLTNQALLSSTQESHEKNQEKIDVLKRSEAQSIEELQRSVRYLEGQCLGIENKLIVPPLKDAVAAMNALSTIDTTLIEVFTQLPANPNKTYSSLALDNERNNLALLETKYNSIRAKEAQTSESIKHMAQHKATPNLNCPKCKHAFSTHYDAGAHTLLLQKELNLQNEATQISVQINKAKEFIERCNNYATLYRLYLNTVRQWSILKPYFDKLNDSQVLLTTPAQALFDLQEWKNDLSLQIDYAKQSELLIEKRKLLIDLQKVGTGDLVILQAQQTERDNLIESLTAKLQETQTRKNQLNDDRTRLLAIAQYKQEVTNLIRTKKAVFTEQQEMLRRTSLNNLIGQFHAALGLRESRLQSLGIQQGIVNDLHNQLYELEQNEIATQHLLRELSPTEGIIAEGLMQFMQRFVRQMNQVIAQVWSYPLTIQACEFTEGETLDLDYRFPMIVSGDPTPRQDVSKGSTGMLEIVNFAFVLVAKHYLHIADHPINLDEFAKAMDCAHKAQSVMLIRQLLDSGLTQQIFMISHDFSQYSANLSSAEVTVLCPNNVVVPEVYNEHVTLS